LLRASCYRSGNHGRWRNGLRVARLAEKQYGIEKTVGLATERMPRLQEFGEVAFKRKRKRTTLSRCRSQKCNFSFLPRL
jgi:hypothetical protein